MVALIDEPPAERKEKKAMVMQLLHQSHCSSRGPRTHSLASCMIRGAATYYLHFLSYYEWHSTSFVEISYELTEYCMFISPTGQSPVLDCRQITPLERVYACIVDPGPLQDRAPVLTDMYEYILRTHIWSA